MNIHCCVLQSTLLYAQELPYNVLIQPNTSTSKPKPNTESENSPHFVVLTNKKKMFYSNPSASTDVHIIFNGKFAHRTLPLHPWPASVINTSDVPRASTKADGILTLSHSLKHLLFHQMTLRENVPPFCSSLLLFLHTDTAVTSWHIR